MERDQSRFPRSTFRTRGAPPCPRHWSPTRRLRDASLTSSCSENVMKLRQLSTGWSTQLSPFIFFMKKQDEGRHMVKLVQIMACNLFGDQVGVSLPFLELSKIFSQNFCIPKFIPLVRILSWKLCTRAQSHAFSTCTKFLLEILTINVISGIVHLSKIIWRDRETLVKQLPENLNQSWLIVNWTLS